MENKKLTYLWWGIDLHSSVVTYDTISWLTEDDRLNSESCYELSEDLLQIEFKDKNLLIDVGWYNPFQTKQGFLRIELIQNMNWERPLFKRNFRKINTVKQQISQLISRIEQQQFQ